MLINQRFHGRVGIQQRVVPFYRIEFFDLLAQSCSGGLSVFAGDVPQNESIPTRSVFNHAEYSNAKNFHFQDIQSSYYFLWQGRLLEWLKNWNPDVLIVEANPRYLSTSQGIRWMHSHNRPVIGWGLGAPNINGKSKLAGSIVSSVRNSLRKRMLGQLDSFIAYSHKGGSEYHQIAGPGKPIYVAPNAVAKSPIGEAPRRGTRFDGPPVVLFVGRLQERKKLDNLIVACSKLSSDIQPKLVIVGDGPERLNLEEIAKVTYPATKFMGHKVGEELSNLFLEADIFVLPGTGGLAIQEAMSYALPVIVAEGDGTQHDLISPDNGWIIPSDDQERLLATLRIALSNPRKLREMGECSFRIVQDQVNIEQMVYIFIEALNHTSREGQS
jgi:glycosyltransferase involved in cell wall biosynthesis